MRAAEAILAAGVPLNGLSADWASLYGMPHQGAFYAKDDVDSHTLEWDAVCCVCGRPATDAHHCPPKSKGRTFALRTGMGIFILKPALFALCRGCHMKFHGEVGRGPLLLARWEWNSEEDAEAWYSGELMSHGTPPNSPKLLYHGRWVIDERG